MRKLAWLWASLAVVLCGSVLWYVEQMPWRMDLGDMPTQLVNGGFENGDDMSWIVGGYSGYVADSGGREQPGCLTLHVPPAEHRPEPGALVHTLPEATQAVRVEAGSLIRVVCWVRSTASTAVGRLSIECRSPYCDTEELYTYEGLVTIWGTPVVSVGEWCRTELTVCVPTGTAYVVIGCEALGSEGDVAFDDFSLELER